MTLRGEALGHAFDGRVVVDGIDVRLEPGELLGVVGPNGSGKSTLLRMLAGLLRPARGCVWSGGDDLFALEPRERARRLAWLPQTPRVAFAFTVLQVALLGRTARAGGLLDGPADRDAALEALAACGVLDLAERPLESLSGGERQRVFLAQALAQQAPVVLLDEPTAHLDPGQAMAVWENLRARLSAPLAVAAVLHDVNLAAQFCDRLLVLSAGRAMACGPPSVLDADLLARVYGVRAHVGRHPERDVPFIVPLR